MGLLLMPMTFSEHEVLNYDFLIINLTIELSSSLNKFDGNNLAMFEGFKNDNI